ncbi:MAG: hypothetical protein RR413_11415 [Christensenellaceae bacterium]
MNGVKMRKKEWQIRHARKALMRLTKLNQHQYGSKRQVHKYSRNVKSMHGRHTVKAPENCSVSENTEETLAFFNVVIETIQKSTVHDKIYFDLSDTKHLTIDAVMYIIALITNMRRIRGCRIECSGNVPKCEDARLTLEKSGFYKFVSSNTKGNVREDTKTVQITSGTRADGVLVGNLCDFVQNTSMATRCSTKRLYPMILELMTNTNQHAYKGENGLMIENWYVFAEKCAEGLRFIFLDTGVGIPKTIRKKVTEKLSTVIQNNDAVLIASALRGDELRSETRKSYRGKGLPQIYDDCKMGTIKKMLIVSGRGICRLLQDGTIEEYTSSVAFQGTLFSWEFMCTI